LKCVSMTWRATSLRLYGEEMKSTHEERMGEEISRLQNKAREDLERLREEHAAARDREIRALRGRA